MEPRTPLRQESDSILGTSGSFSSVDSRLWRPAAQRNMRNQWSKMASLWGEWSSTAATARSHATSIVNAYLSQKFMDDINLGVLKDMPNIRKKACWKLFNQQERYRRELLSSYRDMVSVVAHMVDVCNSMRCYFKGTNSSPLAQFSCSLQDNNDSGDCGGMPVFASWPISYFEELVWEIVQMFISELKLKRLLVLEFLSIYDDKVNKHVSLCWSDEFYKGEFEDLSKCTLYSTRTCEVALPCLERFGSCSSIIPSNQQLDSKILQVYITTWLAELNINRCRVDDIFAVVEAEVHVVFQKSR